MTVTELKKTFGISNAKACQLLAAVELGKRMASAASPKRQAMETVRDVVQFIMPKMRGLKIETLKTLCLDSRLRLLKEETVSVGGLNTNSVHASDVFRPAVSEAAAALILVHNHPSGDPRPSRKDIITTGKLSRIGKLLGIEILDHIIIGDGIYASFKELNLL
jgi:DNA repair protein RadC